MASLIIGIVSFIAGSAITIVIMCLLYAASEAESYSLTELGEEIVAECANSTEPSKED